jgi:hypothetical protein
MTDSLNNAEFLEWVEAACAGSIEPEQMQQLSARLADSDPCRRVYLDYCRMHTDLNFMVRSESAEQSMAEQFAALAEAGASPSKTERLAEWIDRVFAPWTHPWRFAAGALLATGVIWVVFFSAILPWGRAPQLADAPAPSQPTQLVAELVESVDARWGAEEHASLGGQFVHAGQTLELKRGWAEFEFKSGATVVLHGPARFISISTLGGRLEVGSLTARAPASAKGFFVAAPYATVVDLGTEFSVTVDERERSTVYVFEGVVEAQLLDDAGNIREVARLVEGESVRIDGGLNRIARIAVDAETIPRSLPAPPKELHVDFAHAAMDKETGHHVEKGFSDFSLATTSEISGPVSKSFRTQLGKGDVLQVTVSSDNGKLTWRDRGDLPDLLLGDVAEDFITSSLGVRVQLGRLAAGEYAVTTYHHDLKREHEAIDISVDDADGANRSAAQGIDISSGTAPLATATFTVRSDGKAPVQIHISRDTSRHAILNGFSIAPRSTPK